MYNGNFDNKEEEYFNLRNTELIDIRGKMILNARNKITKNGDICEIGGGTGNMSIYMASKLNSQNIRIIVFEPLANYIKLASQKALEYNNIIFVNDIFENLSYHNKYISKVDFFYAIDTLHHINTPTIVLDNIAKISASTKHLIIIEPNLYNIYIYLYHKLKKGEEVFKQNEFMQYAEINGWRVKEKKYFYAIPLKLLKYRYLKKLDELISKCKYLGGSIYINLTYGE